MGVRKNFVVKNGLEVDERILYVDAINDKVGVGTIYPEYETHVIGSIGCTDINITRNASVSGILTANELDFTGSGISVGDTTGLPGQYLRSTGTGVEWASFPTNLRSTFAYTATDLQTTFAYAYTAGFLDVYVNGVKLKGDGVTDVSEYTAVNGTQVVLTEPAFSGDFIELVAYNPASVAAGGDGVLGFTIQEEGVIVGNDNGVTSINFIGAAVTAVGSGAGVTVYIAGGGSGGGLVIREEGVIQGSDITSLNFVGTAVTVTASGAGATAYIGQIDPIPGINTSGTSTFNNINATGIITASGFVGSLTGNSSTATVATNAQGLTGSPNIVVGIITATSYSGSGAGLTSLSADQLVGALPAIDGSALTGIVGSGSGVLIKDSGSTVGTAGTIDFGDNLSVSPISAGIVTVTGSAAGVGTTGLQSRNTSVQTTGSVGAGVTTDITFTGYKSYLLMKIETSAASWVRIYTDTSSRTSDASREEGTDPLPGSGVIAEVITTGAETQLLSPGTIGFNNESTPTEDIYAKVTNNSGITTDISVTLTILQLEVWWENTS